MVLSYPAFTYYLPEPFTNARGQAVASADRPFCALVSACAALDRGQELKGSAYGLAPDFVLGQIDDRMTQDLVPMDRLNLWMQGINLERMGEVKPRTFLGRTTDPYQDYARSRLTVSGGVLRLGVGLGKTLTTVGAIFDYLERGIAPRVWIICPLNAYGAWLPYLPLLQARCKDVQILSQDSLHKVVDAVPSTGGILVLDEVHGFGRPTSERTQHVHRVRRAFDVGIGLTGTMLHGGVEKALSILDLATPGQSLFATKWGAGEYFHCLVKKNVGSREVTDLGKPVGPNRVAFMEYLDRAVVSLTKESGVVTQSVLIPEQHLTEVEIGGDMGRSVDELTAEAAMRIYDETGELPHASAVVHLLLRAGAEAKVQWLVDQLESDDEPVVVFAHYTETMDLAENALIEAGALYARVDGQTKQADRVEAARKFQAGEIRVFLGQIQAAGIAVDLYRAQVSVTLDVSWKGNQYSQALGRTCRRGQAEPCLNIDLLANKLQRRVVSMCRADEEFDTSTAEYQEVKNALVLASFAITPPLPPVVGPSVKPKE